MVEKRKSERIYIYINKLSVCYVCYTLSVTPDYIFYIYKISFMYFCVEGLNVKTGNCINIWKYFDNRLMYLKTLKKILNILRFIINF